jgi:putative transposase
VRTVKSITTREMREQHEPFLKEYLWSGGFWEESYYVGTTGDVSTDTIEQYIERTEHVHRSGRTSPSGPIPEAPGLLSL